MRGIERAVEDHDLRVLHRCAKARGHKARRGCEYYGAAVIYRAIDQALRRIHQRIKVRNGLYLPVKHTLDILPAPLMPSCPCRAEGISVMHKSHLGSFRLSAQNFLDDARLLFLRVKLNVNGIPLLPEHDLFPHLGKRVPDYLRASAPQSRISVDLHIGQHRVSGCFPKIAAAPALIRLAEKHIRRRKAAPLLLRPCLFRKLPDQPLERRVAARVREFDEIDPAQPVEVQKLIVELCIGAPFRQDTENTPRYLRRVKKFQNTDALVPLLYIEAVHKLERLDRFLDAFFQMRVAQVLPFGGKLRPRFEQRHKIRGKGILAAA